MTEPCAKRGSSPVLVEIPPLERVKIKQDAPFTFTATVEIKPKIELRDYKAPNPISLKPDKRTVTDEQLAKGMEVLREQHARLDAPPAGHKVVEGDYVCCMWKAFSRINRWKAARKPAICTK